MHRGLGLLLMALAPVLAGCSGTVARPGHNAAVPADGAAISHDGPAATLDSGTGAPRDGGIVTPPDGATPPRDGAALPSDASPPPPDGAAPADSAPVQQDASVPQTDAPVIPTSALLLGVYVGNDPPDLAQFEAWLGRRADGVLCYTGDRDWNDMHPGWIMGQYAGRHCLFSIPLFPQTSSLAAVANGDGNSHFSEYAQYIDTNGVPAPDGNIYVRTGWEMGGEWFPWGAQGNAHPELFRAAFAHFADAFHAVSGRFKIVWDVVGDRGDMAPFWPGDQYVDVVSQDFYWNPQWTSEDGAIAFNMMRDFPCGLQWIEDFAAAHGKPTAYSEWGSKEGAGFIQAAKAWFDAHQPIYQTYWNSDAAYPGKLSSGQYPAAGAAYQQAFGP